MMKDSLSLLILVFIFLGFNGCQTSEPVNNSGNAPTEQTVTKPVAPTFYTIIITSGAVGKGPAAFTSTPLKVKVGATVTWINNDSLVHTVTEVTEVWDSNYLKPGQSFSFRFTEAREYYYYDVRYGYDSMSGVIIVSED